MPPSPPTAPVQQSTSRSEPSVLRYLAWASVVAGLIFAAVAWAVGDIFYLRLATEALIFAGLAMSADLLLGYCGLLSLGQALFFGLGAYVSGLFLKEVTPNFWLDIATVLVSAVVVSALAGYVALRSTGVYFALLTFAMAQVAGRVIYNVREIGGSDGIIGIPTIGIGFGLFRIDLSDPLQFFLFAFVVVMANYFALAWLMGTPFGRTLQAIRAKESRLPHLGYNPQLFKLYAFILAGVIAAFYGALYPMLRGFVAPELLTFEVSGNAVISAIVGGTGTLIGAVLGTLFIVFLKSIVGSYTEHHHIVIGLLFMLVVIFFPRGFAGYLKVWAERRRDAKQGGEHDR